MEITQKTYLKVTKGSKDVIVVLDQDMSLGLLFDALMELKTFTLDQMAKAHEEENAKAKEKMGAKEVEEPVKEEVKEESSKE